MEQTRIISPMEERARINQRINLELKPEIQRYEEEYWGILAAQTELLEFQEQESETIVAEIVAEVNQIEANKASEYPKEVLQVLQDIRDSLRQPGKPAAAKLKGVISSFPPFFGVSYEAELDTESFFQRHFPTFTRLIKGATKQ